MAYINLLRFHLLVIGCMIVTSDCDDIRRAQPLHAGTSTVQSTRLPPGPDRPQRHSYGPYECMHADLTLPLKPLPDSVVFTDKMMHPVNETDSIYAAYKMKYTLKTVWKGPMIDGNRDCAEIADTISAHLPHLRYTYNKMLRLSPGLVGRVGFWFVITGSGNVIDCRIVETTMNRTDQQDSLVNDILEWRFNPLPDSTDTTITAFSLWFGS